MISESFTFVDLLTPSLAVADEAIKKGIGATMAYYAPITESEAKSNAPWTDRTGNARAGLSAQYTGGDGEYTITLSHGVPYGIYLEAKWSGRYAVIMPTIESIGPRIMATMSKIMASI